MSIEDVISAATFPSSQAYDAMNVYNMVFEQENGTKRFCLTPVSDKTSIAIASSSPRGQRKTSSRVATRRRARKCPRERITITPLRKKSSMIFLNNHNSFQKRPSAPTARGDAPAAGRPLAPRFRAETRGARGRSKSAAGTRQVSGPIGNCAAPPQRQRQETAKPLDRCFRYCLITIW